MIIYYICLYPFVSVQNLQCMSKGLFDLVSMKTLCVTYDFLRSLWMRIILVGRCMHRATSNECVMFAPTSEYRTYTHANPIANFIANPVGICYGRSFSTRYVFTQITVCKLDPLTIPVRPLTVSLQRKY